MRPTKGEISVTPASAQATAWAKLNSSGRLQWMPSRSNSSAPRMPSQVLVVRLLGRLVDEGRVGGRVLRPVFGDGLEIARVGHDRRVSLQGFQEIHGDTSCGALESRL